MRLEIFGEIFSSSGYSQHTRFLANALFQFHDDINLNIPLPQGWETMVNDKEMSMINKPPVKDYTAIFIGQPQAWRFVLSNKPTKFGGYIIFEGDSIPLSWIEYMADKRVDWLFVPSNHVKQALINAIEAYKTQYKADYSYILDKVYQIPHGVDDTIYKPNKEVLKDDGRLHFICSKGWRGGWNDRSGIAYLLKAFIEEFHESDFVSLYVHINPAYPCNLVEELQKLGLRQEDVPEVKLEMRYLTYKELNEFYNQGDVYVSTSMAEAFNIPLIEAMACGKPCISTFYGGMSDFVTEQNGWLIGGELIPVTWDLQYEGTQWLKPDIQQLQKVMRNIYEKWKQGDTSELSAKSANALATSKEYTWELSARKLLEIIQK